MPFLSASTLGVSSMCSREEAKMDRLFSSKSLSLSCWKTIQRFSLKASNRLSLFHDDVPANLTSSKERLDHSATMRHPHVDHTQKGMRDVVVVHVMNRLYDPLQKPVELGVLAHQPQLVVPLLVRHLLQGGPHAGQAAADLPIRGRVLTGEVQDVRRRAALLQASHERGGRPVQLDVS